MALCACKACRKFASSTRNDKKPVEKKWRREVASHTEMNCKAVQSCFSVLARPHYAIERRWACAYVCMFMCLPPSDSHALVLSRSGALIRCQDNVAIVAIMPHAKRQFGQCLGHKLQHLGYQHLVTLHLATEP